MSGLKIICCHFLLAGFLWLCSQYVDPSYFPIRAARNSVLMPLLSSDTLYEFKSFTQIFRFYSERVRFVWLKIHLQKSAFELKLSMERNILPELVVGVGICLCELHEVTLVHFSVSGSCCMEALTSSILTTLMSFRHLLRVHPILSSRWLMKSLNSIGSVLIPEGCY